MLVLRFIHLWRPILGNFARLQKLWMVLGKGSIFWLCEHSHTIRIWFLWISIRRRFLWKILNYHAQGVLTQTKNVHKRGGVVRLILGGCVSEVRNFFKHQKWMILLAVLQTFPNSLKENWGIGKIGTLKCCSICTFQFFPIHLGCNSKFLPIH